LKSNSVNRAVSYIRGKLQCKAGVSLIELVVTMVILSLLAMVVLPSAQLTSKRLKEMELRRTLRMVRTAIDDYKKAYEEANKGKQDTTGLKSGYPKELKTLVEGEDFGDLKKTKKKFLRRIPIDPFNPAKPGEEPKWGIRAYKDDDCKPDPVGADDVYDICSMSEETAIDGTKYKEW
jgi:general secretion pathway protein G